MGAGGVNFNCTVCAEVSGVKIWRIPRSQRKLLLKVRAVKYVPKGKLGQNALLILTHLLMQTLLLLNTARTLTTPRNQKVAKGRVSNGKATGLGR